eukprot:Hpha_TRINITY_DN15710_c3_g7::TRINITY_DN15710_c3_g7_i1::g.41689::m.41689
MRCHLLLSLALLHTVSGQDVYDDMILARARRGDPHCEPPEQHLHVGEGRVGHLMSLGDLTDRVRINCAVIDVRRAPNSSDSCGKETLPSRLYVVARMADGSAVHEWHVDNVLGGSIDEVVYSTQGPANFSLEFHNDHQSCPVWATWSVNHCIAGKQDCPPVAAVDVTYTLPTLVGLTPASIYLKDSEPVTFCFQQARNPHPHDRAKAIHRDGVPPLTVDPCQYEGPHAYNISRGDGEGSEEVDEEGFYAYYTHRFKRVGLYYICYAPYQPDGQYDYQEVATVTVFGGNPDYFMMTVRRPERPHMPWTYVFTYYGEGLDLRPHRLRTTTQIGQGDRAKLVFQTGDCSDELKAGEAGAGGTFMGVDLGPDNTYPSHFAEYPVQFRTGGRFRLCYQRFGHEWVEVPNIEDLPDGFFSHTRPGHATPAPLGPAKVTPTPVTVLTPEPGTTITLQKYPTCTPRQRPPSTPPRHTDAEIELNNMTMPEGFLDALSNVLGVPSHVVQVSNPVYLDKAGTKHLQMDVDFYCSLFLKEDGTEGCTNRDLKNMIYLLDRNNDTCFQSLGIVRYSEHVAEGGVRIGCSSGNDCLGTPPHESSHVMGTIFTVLAVLAGVAVVAVGGLYAWRENGFATPGEMIASVTKGTSWGDGADREMI